MTAENEVAGIIDRNVYMEPTLRGLLQSLPIQWVVAFFAIFLLIMCLSAYDHYSAEKEKVLANLAKKQAALDAAEQARQAESSFLSSMSHDIRTPLNGILGYTHLAKKSENMGEIRQFLERIDGSGQLMLDIVNDILDLSKIESGKMQLISDWFDIRELFKAIESSISMNAETKDIEFTSEFDVTLFSFFVSLGFWFVVPAGLPLRVAFFVSTIVNFMSKTVLPFSLWQIPVSPVFELTLIE